MSFCNCMLIFGCDLAWSVLTYVCSFWILWLVGSFFSSLSRYWCATCATFHPWESSEGWEVAQEYQIEQFSQINNWNQSRVSCQKAFLQISLDWDALTRSRHHWCISPPIVLVSQLTAHDLVVILHLSVVCSWPSILPPEHLKAGGPGWWFHTPSETHQNRKTIVYKAWPLYDNVCELCDVYMYAVPNDMSKVCLGIMTPEAFFTFNSISCTLTSLDLRLNMP